MSLFTVFITLAVIGLCLYLVKRFIPMDSKIATIITWVVVIAAVIFALQSFGMFRNVPNLKIK